MPTVVNCPTCKTKVEWSEQSPHRPFCSKRCADLDLGKWLTEAYTIPAVETDDEDSIPTDFSSNESNLH